MAYLKLKETEDRRDERHRQRLENGPPPTSFCPNLTLEGTRVSTERTSLKEVLTLFLL